MAGARDGATGRGGNLATGSRVYVTILASVAAIGGFLFGFDSGVINGAVDAMSEAFHASHVGTGFAVASILLGCAVGAFAAGTLADMFGRKSMMLVTAVVFVTSGIGTGIAPNVTIFNVFRLLGGLAVGAASVLAPAYIAEVAPAHIRGRLGSLQQLAIVVGLFIAFLSNYTIAWLAGSASMSLWWGYQAWRWMFWVEVIPAAAFFLGALLIPESPRYLVMRGREPEAARIFHRIIGGDAEERIREVVRSLVGGAERRIVDIFLPGTWRIRPIVWVGMGLSAFQQFVGINVIFYYGAVLWQAAGSTESQALMRNLITGGTNIVSTFIAIALIDKLGRKPLLLIGSAGMLVTLAVEALAFHSGSIGPTGDLQLSHHAALTALIAANLYIVFFAISWGPVVWVMLGEMFPNRFRGAGLAAAAAVQWLANFVVTLTFPLLLTGIGLSGAYGLYALAALLSLLFVGAFIRETKGRQLEDMG